MTYRLKDAALQKKLDELSKGAFSADAWPLHLHYKFGQKRQRHSQNYG